jgi:hypothetical protein
MRSTWGCAPRRGGGRDTTRSSTSATKPTGGVSLPKAVHLAVEVRLERDRRLPKADLLFRRVFTVSRFL